MEISLSWRHRLQKSNWKSEKNSSPTRWKSASRGVKHSKNQIENPKFFQVQHDENQPLVESNTPKIESKIQKNFKSNTVEISVSWSQHSKNQIENPKIFQVQHGGNQPLVAL